jgi:hypothetical protein
MLKRRVVLYDIDTLFLVIECASTVVYQNQVGGVVCFQAELEGVLAQLDVSEEILESIMNCDFFQGRQGIDAAIADKLDAVFRANHMTSFITVDREKLDESWEAWIHVRLRDMPDTFELPREGEYHGLVFGFSNACAVVTWPNSD